MKNKFIRDSLLFVLVLGLLFSCKDKKSNCELWITGFKEGTTTVRKLGICRDNTFFLEKIDFWDKEIIRGVWERNSNSEISLKINSNSNIIAKISLTVSPELIVAENQDEFNDKLVKEMNLMYLD